MLMFLLLALSVCPCGDKCQCQPCACENFKLVGDSPKTEVRRQLKAPVRTYVSKVRSFAPQVRTYFRPAACNT
jgi:hypothetical protein